MFKAVDKWLPGYIKSVLQRPRNVEGPKHLMFCVADHFEPFGYRVPREETFRSFRSIWLKQYPASVKSYCDAEGTHPRHTFFFPQDQYDAEFVDMLGELCAGGYGEVEVHLHHGNDTPTGTRQKLTEFRDSLHGRHGFLGTDKAGNTRYGFVHGNWALCNSLSDDSCGVNEELGILQETGCYADFTFPSAPDQSQPKMVNTIYRACDIPGKPRGHDSGMRVSVNKSATPDGLMLIQGPLGVNWRKRKPGMLPRIDGGDMTYVDPASPDRIDFWVKQHIHVLGQPNWIFVKIHTHGSLPMNKSILLGSVMQHVYEHLGRNYNDDQKNWFLHYVTAREMYNIIRAAEDGKTGNPGEYRDYEILPPPVLGK